MRVLARKLGIGMPVDAGALAIAPLGIAAIVISQAVAGVPLQALAQAEAALIVVGGTLGALVVSHSLAEVIAAVRAAARTFRPAITDLEPLFAQIIALAVRSHRRGVISVEAELDTVADPFLRDGLMFALDESSVGVVREVLTADAASRNGRDEAPARLLEAAAGYAPTFGILGAVLGLIHVMRSLGSPGALGNGIAVAFVATVYGLGIANLILLPLAGRIRERAAVEARRRELMSHGIYGIHQRIHPRLLAHKLRAFAPQPATRARSVRRARATMAEKVPA